MSLLVEIEADDFRVLHAAGLAGLALDFAALAGDSDEAGDLVRLVVDVAREQRS